LLVSSPLFNTTKANGVCPLTSSFKPITAHSSTFPLSTIACSICPPDNRCPATLRTSSARDDVSIKPSFVRIPTSAVS
jgi:hypothetical protein